jgi:NAD-dependent dihydropyrimidine dehydrogenase PreA subunit
MSGTAIIMEACIGTKDRVSVDVRPVQCIYEFDPVNGVLFTEVEAGREVIESSQVPNADAVAIFGDSLLYANVDDCTPRSACYQPDLCPVGAIYSEERVPDGSPNSSYNFTDTSRGHDHTFFVQLTADVFAD